MLGVYKFFFVFKEKYDLFVNKGTEKLCVEYGIPFLGQLPLDRVSMHFQVVNMLIELPF